jgi:glycosyltransferase involved in cell wall biosynthesis
MTLATFCANQETGSCVRARTVAVIVPAFDEAENVAALFAELRAAFARHRLEGEIVFVDDGSTDGTFRIAQREAARGRVRVLRHNLNLGKTEALLTGAAATSCERIVLFDADLQHDPDDIPRLLAPLDDGWDIVTGRKVGVYQKRFVSLVYNAVCRRIFRVPVRDLNSIKAFRREVLVSVPLRHDWHRYLVALAVARGFAVTEVDVALRPRRAGRSKYAGLARVLSGCRDLAAVWWHVRFGRPAKAVS